jgi:hypothetical protein
MKMKTMNNLLVQAINLALQLLSQRVFSFLCLALTAAAFGWCLYDPSILRIVTSSIFGLLCLMYQRKDADKPKETDNV